MGTISQHQVTTFTSPTNGQTPIDATVVKGNDNTLKTYHNAHDADATIHVQSGLVAGRPSAGTANQTWLTTDPGAVYLYLDTGSVWVEANYLHQTSAGNVSVSGTFGVTGVTTLSGAVTMSVGAVVTTGGLQVGGGLTIASGLTTVQSLSCQTGMAVVAGGLNIVAGGLIVASGASALQAVTGTTFTFTGGGSYAAAQAATNITTGFFYVCSCNGTPSGVPSGTPTGQIPVMFDSTNNKFYAYLNAAWKSVTLA